MSNYILNNTASDIDTALGKVLSPDTSPQDTDNLVTSGGVKTYVDSAVANIDTDTDSLQADVAALQTTVNSYFQSATLTLPQTSYWDTRDVTGWVKSDPNSLINFDGSRTFSLKLNNAAKAGLYSATIVLTAFDEDGGGDRHVLQFYKNGSNISGMEINLDNAQNSNGGFRTATWAIGPGETWFIKMYERTPNTTTTLSNTSIKITKIT